MGRKPCCDKVGIKRGPWTNEEDHKLTNFILANGILCWRNIPKLAGLLRCGKSCRLRWINYLRPDLKRGGFTKEEEDQIVQLHSTLGNRWSKIASHFVGRTDNEIKNHWNTKIKKRLRGIAVDRVSDKCVELKGTKKESSDAACVINVKNNLDNGIKDFASKIMQNDDKEVIKNDINEDDLLSEYEIFNGSIEVLEHWLNEESIEELDGQSSSASFQDSLNASMSEFSPELLENQSSDSDVQHGYGYVHPWFDEMDFFCEFKNNLEDQSVFP